MFSLDNLILRCQTACKNVLQPKYIAGNMTKIEAVER